MKPSDELLRWIETRIAPELHPLGFRFAPSKRRFQREVGAFTQVLSFTASGYSTPGAAVFWCNLGCKSKSFRRWFKDVWGQLPPQPEVLIRNDGLVPNWGVVPGVHRELTSSNGAALAAELLADVRGPGLAFLDRISTAHGAAEYFIEEGWRLVPPCDLFAWSGDLDGVRRALRLGRETVRRPHYQSELPELAVRESRYLTDAV